MDLLLKMNKCWLILLLLITIPRIINTAKAATFGDPPFLEGPKDKRIEFRKFTNNIQEIAFEEEITEPIIIAYVNYNENEPQPKVGSFYSGTNVLLGAELQFDKKKEKWALVIKNKQDYETQSMREYLFGIFIDGNIDDIRMVQVEIINIPDNYPIITTNQNNCEVQETEIGVGATKCTYNVTDIDELLPDLEYNLEGETAEFFGYNIEKIDKMHGKLHLNVQKSLNFDEYVIHLLTFTATNKNDLTGSVLAVVKVINVPSRPPKWQNIFSSKTFDEKTEQTFTILAKDGDVGIDTEIHYRIELENEKEAFFEILDKTKGEVHVKPIDRDELQKEIFYFTIIAYKANNESSTQDQKVLIMVNDINDNIPEITIPKKYLKPIYIEEETYVDFDEPIIVEDLDLPIHATYDIELSDVDDGKIGWNKAFALKPNHGYQKTELQLIIMNASLLDFDTPAWQNITLEIIATETADPTHIDRASIEIRLINLNDEEPIFESNGEFEFEDGVYKVEKSEDIGEGTVICVVKAIDHDIGDKIIYSLSNTAERSFTINKDTGEIKTKLDKSLDYEQQTEVSIQVYAEDSLIDIINTSLHKTQAEVIISVIDINDKTPQISLEYNTDTINIVENTPKNEEVDIVIRAYDPDTTAKLKFSIDWESSRAVKEGRNVPLTSFENCLKIVWEEDGSNNDAIAKLIVQEQSPDVTIDYEMYETLYLNVIVEDLNQEINKSNDTVSIPIYIIDVNDNKPIFDPEITNRLKYVRDKADSDTIIGTVLATDADGPEYNYVTYIIKPLNGIPDNLVTIDKELGEIRVKETINCDKPNYWPSLNYTVIASDCINRDNKPVEPCFETTHDINIIINDINDQKPKLEKFTKGDNIQIYENETHGYLVNQIEAFDNDRNEPFRTIWYTINSPANSEINSIFNVTEDGIFYVNCTNGEKYCLDRDHGDFIYSIDIKMYDNQNGDGNFNQGDADFTIELLDINDNEPIFDQPQDFILKSVKENVKKSTRIDKIHAYDLDDPNLDNSKVVYGIAHAYKVDDDSSKDYADLFDIKTDDKFEYGFVHTKGDLKDHFGDFILNLTVHDKGIPPLSSTQNFSLTILKHNYQEPKILFPTSNLVLQKPDDEHLNDLFVFNGSRLQYFEADDGFKGTKWKISFRISPEEFFELEPLDTNKAKLKLKKVPTKTSYDCVLTATDNGDPSFISDKEFKIYFIDDSQPIFEDATSYTEFLEDINGTLQSWKIEPEAIDPLPETFKRQIYYFIIGGDDDRFNLDKITRELTVNKDKPLDRKIAYHSVLVGVTTTDKYPSNLPKESQLNITIKVLGINKYPPKFERDVFKTGIHLNTQIDSQILKLIADDLDLPNDTLRYELDVDSIEVSNPSLDDNKDKTFSINPDTGAIFLKRAVQPSMDGYYTLNVMVYDSGDKSDKAQVSIYIIREDKHQVMFAFNNTRNEVEKEQSGVADTFTNAFENECNIDSILQDVDENTGIAIEDRTRVYTHFIKDNVPIDGEIIKLEANDLETIYRLRTDFKTEYGLIFDYAFKDANTNVKDMQQLLQTILIVVVAVLGTLCILLFAAFIVRTRSLNQRLEALSTTKFGSQDSNLNRIGAPLPNTNQFAVQGSNPVWNDDIKLPEYDVKSMGSGDSTLVGIEDSFTFNNFDEPISPDEQRRASFNPVMQQELKRKSLNPMANRNLQLNDEL